MSARPRPRSERLVLALILVVGVAIVFGQVVTFRFLSFDDPRYVTGNDDVLRGLTLSGLRAAFETTRMAAFQPLAWISHMLDVELWGIDPGGHHVTSALLHAASAVLLFLSLDEATSARRRSFVVAALFALHPLRAESVAWIAERKDVLCTLFCMAALLAYVRYARRPSARGYGLVAAALALALLSKATAVVFPLALLLVDAWPLGRFDREPPLRLLREKVPLAALSLVDLAVMLHVHERAIYPLPLSKRLANAVVSYARLLGHVFVPRHLSIFYPNPYVGGAPLSAAQIAGSACLLAAVVGASVHFRRRAPYLLFGVAWFLGLMLPVSGVVQSGLGGMADRFTYVPSIGIAVATVWLARDALCALRASAAVQGAIAALAVAAYGACAAVEVGHYRDSFTVFGHAIESTGPNWMAEEQLGAAYLQAHDEEAARLHFQRAGAIAPQRPAAYVAAAQQALEAGKTAEALQDLRYASLLDPGSADVFHTMGRILAPQRRFEEALSAFESARRIRPDDAQVQNDECAALLALRRDDAALACLKRAVALDPAMPTPYWNLQILYERTGRRDLAVEAGRMGDARGARPR